MKRTKFINLKDAKFYNTRTAYVKDVIQDKAVKLLDVGNLGDGPVNVDLRTLITNNGGEYYGLDVNKNLADSLGFKNQLIGDLHDLNGVVESNSFDVVYAGQVIEHTWRPDLIIKECWRILKSEGILIMDTPNIYDFTNIGRYFFKFQDTVGMDEADLVYQEALDNFQSYRNAQEELLSQPQHKILYSSAMLRQLHNMHGFEIKDYIFIGKPRNIFHKILLKIWPQGSQKIGIVSRKSTVQNIFEKVI